MNGESIGDQRDILGVLKTDVYDNLKRWTQELGALGKAARESGNDFKAFMSAAKFGDVDEFMLSGSDKLSNFLNLLDQFSSGSRKTFPKQKFDDINKTFQSLKELQGLVGKGTDKNLDSLVDSYEKVVNVAREGLKVSGIDNKQGLIGALLGKEGFEGRLSEEAADKLEKIVAIWGDLSDIKIGKIFEGVASDVKDTEGVLDVVSNIAEQTKQLVSDGHTNLTIIPDEELARLQAADDKLKNIKTGVEDLGDPSGNENPLGMGEEASKQIESLNSKVKELSESLKKLQDDYDALDYQKGQSDEQLSRVLAENGSLLNDLDQLREKYSEANNTVASLKTQIED